MKPLVVSPPLHPPIPCQVIFVLLSCVVFFFGWTPYTQAAPPRRCLSSLDCPNHAPCVNRQCFQGLKITIESHRTSAYRIAIAPILLMGQPSPAMTRLGQQIYRQIETNFKRLMGTFQLISPRSFLEQAPHNGLELGTFQFEPWRKIGTHGLLKIALRSDASGSIMLHVRFYDVDGAQLSLRINQTIQPRYYTWHVHQICDRIYHYLTGNPGIFATQIAYVQRNPKGGKDIWVVHFDGSNRRRLVSNGHLNLMPAWSPDGRHVVFTSFMDGRPNLYRVELGTGRVHRLSQRRGSYTGAVFSPNGQHLAFSWGTPDGGSSDIYTTTAGGDKMKRLTDAWGIDTSPTWSPDGKMIAFVSERFAHPHLFLMNADGSQQTRLTYKGDYNQEPRWSPRHQEILFTARDEYLQYDLFVITLERSASGQVETQYRRLTQNQGSNLEATWSPDGRFVLFISTRYGERKMFLMNADGTHQRLFLRGFGDFETPAWSPPMQHPNIIAAGKKHRPSAVTPPADRNKTNKTTQITPTPHRSSPSTAPHAPRKVSAHANTTNPATRTPTTQQPKSTPSQPAAKRPSSEPK